MDDVQDFIMNYEGEQRDLLNFLYELLMDQPGMTCKIAYRVPFFILKQRICYLNPHKDGSIEIAFPRGHQLSNEQGILETKGRSYIKGIVIAGMDEIPLQKLHEVIQEAILLDDIPYVPPYAFKKKKL